MSNCHIILVTEDEDFSKVFLEYFGRVYGVRNKRKGFAKTYLVKNFHEALELIKPENDHHVLVFDKETIAGDWVAYYLQSQERLLQSILLYESDSSAMEMDKRLFRTQTFFVVMGKSADLTTDDRLPERARIFHMSKQSIFDQIDDAIMAYPRGMALHMELRDPITYLPSARLMEQKLKEVRNKPGETILFVELDNHEYVKDTLGYDDFCEVALFMADIIEQAVDEQVPNAWIGGVASYFIVAMPIGYRKTVRQKIQALFEENISRLNLPRQDVKLKLVFDNQSSLPPDFRITIND